MSQRADVVPINGIILKLYLLAFVKLGLFTMLLQGC